MSNIVIETEVLREAEKALGGEHKETFSRLTDGANGSVRVSLAGLPNAVLRSLRQALAKDNCWCGGCEEFPFFLNTFKTPVRPKPLLMHRATSSRVTWSNFTPTARSSLLSERKT